MRIHYSFPTFLHVPLLTLAFLFLFCFLRRFYLFYFQREGEGRRKRGRNINMWLPLAHPLLGIWPATQACALTGNQTCDPSLCTPMLNPLSYTIQDNNFRLSNTCTVISHCGFNLYFLFLKEFFKKILFLFIF